MQIYRLHPSLVQIARIQVRSDLAEPRVGSENVPSSSDSSRDRSDRPPERSCPCVSCPMSLGIGPNRPQFVVDLSPSEAVRQEQLRIASELSTFDHGRFGHLGRQDLLLLGYHPGCYRSNWAGSPMRSGSIWQLRHHLAHHWRCSWPGLRCRGIHIGQCGLRSWRPWGPGCPSCSWIDLIGNQILQYRALILQFLQHVCHRLGHLGIDLLFPMFRILLHRWLESRSDGPTPEAATWESQEEILRHSWGWSASGWPAWSRVERSENSEEAHVLDTGGWRISLDLFDDAWQTGNLGGILLSWFPESWILLPQYLLTPPTWSERYTSASDEGGEHSLETSIKYKSVRLSWSGNTRFKRLRIHWSLLVSKMPPSCLKALLLNRKGVWPGTTSIANHNFRGELSAFNNGIWTRYELVSVWLFPKRNLTWLFISLIWEFRVAGRHRRNSCNTFSPIMQRLAPVSRIAWHGWSQVAVKHSRGRSSFHWRNIRRAGMSRSDREASFLWTSLGNSMLKNFGVDTNFLRRLCKPCLWELSKSSRTTKASSQVSVEVPENWYEYRTLFPVHMAWWSSSSGSEITSSGSSTCSST